MITEKALRQELKNIERIYIKQAIREKDWYSVMDLQCTIDNIKWILDGEDYV